MQVGKTPITIVGLRGLAGLEELVGALLRAMVLSYAVYHEGQAPETLQGSQLMAGQALKAELNMLRQILLLILTELSQITGWRGLMIETSLTSSSRGSSATA